jgi:hypothetical protein
MLHELIKVRSHFLTVYSPHLVEYNQSLTSPFLEAIVVLVIY